MNGEPRPLAMARRVAPHLAGLQWAIGGSTLLFRLGIESAPRDLDIVTTPEHFGSVAARLAALLGAGTRPSHERYRSIHFVRYAVPAGVVVEVMADIRVLSRGTVVAWHFDPREITCHDGLPFMSAQAWLELYTLFERPARAAQLAAYIAGDRRRRTGNTLLWGN